MERVAVFAPLPRASSGPEQANGPVWSASLTVQGYSLAIPTKMRRRRKKASYWAQRESNQPGRQLISGELPREELRRSIERIHADGFTAVPFFWPVPGNHPTNFTRYIGGD